MPIGAEFLQLPPHRRHADDDEPDFEPCGGAQRRSPAPLLPVSLVAMQVAEFQVGLAAKWLSGRHSLKPVAVAEAMLAGVRATIASLLPV